ncbi:YggT family protein [Paenibacillus hunanensis]|uniref:YggT family protein n=2 Tax=Paenibacillus hunanensis TaxID=539262 RepID=A0ABU1J2I7_9BACL|nr:YggT family protein [Paenibacillus hunanensis]MCL9660509.1 YggT family protein [Paenibacillus hunanensis]MDR6245728.1 YggT family protein [Paenibacillus hunanensis]WPP42848.1 YggT family protein [Paenibacillus hunanensis]GGJ19831.1 membrane protein [Paenibacillus hunanensis]
MSVFFEILGIAYRIYMYMIIIYILMSWLPSARESSFGQLLARLVEPYLAPFRRFIPPIGGVLDISPIVALFVLQLAFSGLIYLLQTILF